MFDKGTINISTSDQYHSEEKEYHHTDITDYATMPKLSQWVSEFLFPATSIDCFTLVLIMETWLPNNTIFILGYIYTTFFLLSFVAPHEAFHGTSFHFILQGKSALFTKASTQGQDHKTLRISSTVI